MANHIEAPVAPVFRKLRKGALPANEEEEMALLNFIAMQAIRGPALRDAHDRFTTDVMRQITAIITESETFAAGP